MFLFQFPELARAQSTILSMWDRWKKKIINKLLIKKKIKNGRVKNYLDKVNKFKNYYKHLGIYFVCEKINFYKGKNFVYVFESDFLNAEIL